MEKKVKIMTKELYSKLLRRKEWKLKRIVILERDSYICQKCGKQGGSLHVHHKLYINGKMPWEYSNNHLVTLCGPCHMHEHKTTKIPVIGSKPKKPKKVKQKKKPRTHEQRISRIKHLNQTKEKAKQVRQEKFSKAFPIPQWRLDRELNAVK
jgi:hypothetical protein